MANERRTNQTHALIEEIYKEARTNLTFVLVEEIYLERRTNQVLSYIEFIGANQPTIVTPVVAINYNLVAQYSA